MTLHPPGRHFLDARVKVERRPHADLQRLDGVPVLVGEQILLRTAQTHEHKPDATPGPFLPPDVARAVITDLAGGFQRPVLHMVTDERPG